MTHKHKCPNPQCGHVWEHGREAAGSQKAHECPKCGTEQWWKYIETSKDEDPFRILIEEIFF